MRQGDRMHYWMILALVACGKETIGEQQIETKPVEPAKPAATKPDKPPQTKPEPPKLTAKLVGAKYQGDGHGFGCTSALCKETFAFDASYVGAMTVEAEPGVELLVPGQTLKHGDVWKLDLLDLLTRVRREGAIGDLVVKVPAQLRKGDATLDVETAFDIGWVADVAINAAVKKGKPFVFATDKTSRFTSDAIVIAAIYKDDVTPNAIYPEASYAEVDLIAVERDTSHQASPCAYVDESGTRVNKSRRIADKQVTVYARRTGRVVTSRTFLGATPPCRETMMSNEEIFGYTDTDKILEWEKSLAKPHPGELEPGIEPFAAVGKPLSPEEGGDVPSQILKPALAIGLRDPYPYTNRDFMDSVSGSLGEEGSIDITELREPAPVKDGSVAFANKGDYAVVVELSDKPDAAKLVELVVAKYPDVKAMLSQRLPGQPPNTDKIDDKPMRQSSIFVGGSIWILRKTATAACRAKPKALLCVDLSPNDGSKMTSAKVLAKLKP